MVMINVWVGKEQFTILSTHSQQSFKLKTYVVFTSHDVDFVFCIIIFRLAPCRHVTKLTVVNASSARIALAVLFKQIFAKLAMPV